MMSLKQQCLTYYVLEVFKTMPPKLKAKKIFEDMEIIRPLYLIEEEYIIRWMKSTGLMPLNCACMVAAKKIGTKDIK